MAGPLSDKGPGLRLEVQVVPRASRLRFGPVLGERLKIQLPAPPVDGAANEALTRALAEAFDVPRSAVNLLAGSTGRRKTIEIAPLDEGARQRIRDKVLSWSQ